MMKKEITPQGRVRDARLLPEKLTEPPSFSLVPRAFYKHGGTFPALVYIATIVIHHHINVHLSVDNRSCSSFSGKKDFTEVQFAPRLPLGWVQWPRGTIFVIVCHIKLKGNGFSVTY